MAPLAPTGLLCYLVSIAATSHNNAVRAYFY